MPCCQHDVNGIVHSAMQTFSKVFPAQAALRSGTLFPELHKPMSCAPVPTGCAESSRHQEMAFAAWEMRLYLNTHPQDQNALQMYEQICRQMHEANYACTFAPCNGSGRWMWVDDPWPWETACGERRA